MNVSYAFYSILTGRNEMIKWKKKRLPILIYTSNLLRNYAEVVLSGIPASFWRQSTDTILFTVGSMTSIRFDWSSSTWE